MLEMQEAIEQEREEQRLRQEVGVANRRRVFANSLSANVSLGTVEELQQRIDLARTKFAEYQTLVTRTLQVTDLKNGLELFTKSSEDSASCNLHLSMLVTRLLASQVDLLTWNTNSCLCQLATLLGWLHSAERRRCDVERTFPTLPESFGSEEGLQNFRKVCCSVNLKDWTNIFSDPILGDEARKGIPSLLAKESIEYSAVLGRPAFEYQRAQELCQLESYLFHMTTKSARWHQENEM